MSVIRLRQKGYIRSTGIQAVNWAVTVPVSDPASTPLIATAPLNLAPFFVIRDVGGSDRLERIATLVDFGTVPHAELRYLDIRSPEGIALFSPTVPGGPLGPFPGDELRFEGPQTDHWLEDNIPYHNRSFRVKACVIRESGTNPQLISGNRLILPGYTLTQDDVGRCVNLSGFTTPAYNGICRILSINGHVATINKLVTVSQTGTAWAFPWIEIDTLVSGNEPRFFPTNERNLPWSLYRAGVEILRSSYGAYTSRGIKGPLARSLRYTEVLPSIDQAMELFSVIRNGVYNLQRASETVDTAFTTLMTSTYGV
jgi:hypothetical protein